MKKINKPRALYIHIPFCRHICDYCDFPKLQYFTNFASKYLDKLLEELNSYHIGELDTIYIGGGTPTALDDDLFLRLLEMVKPYIKGVKEYTIECNPESLSISKLKMMKDSGVNRLSIGVESTDDKILEYINRKHTFNDVIKAVDNAHKYGFNNISFDLILGLPQVNLEMLKKDITNLLTLHPTHISCYSLTIHAHTRFYIKGIKEVDNEISRIQYDLVHELLKEKGFIHYEISNWCLPHYMSLHNLTYWKDDRYYGIGLGASGYINDTRYTNTKSLSTYLEGDFIKEEEIVTSKDDIIYYIMLNLRTIYGIDRKDFISRFGFDLFLSKKEELESLSIKGLINISNNYDTIVATYEGMMLLDFIIEELIK